MKEDINTLIRVGLCQPKYYKRSVWLKAKKIMEKLCETEYVIPYDFGRGKGKFTTKNLDHLTFNQTVEFLMETYQKCLLK